MQDILATLTGSNKSYNFISELMKSALLKQILIFASALVLAIIALSFLDFTQIYEYVFSAEAISNDNKIMSEESFKDIMLQYKTGSLRI